MLNKLLRAHIARSVLPAGALVAKTGLTPNAVTTMGALVVVIASFFIATGTAFAGGVVLFAGSMFDMLDGAVAKSTGRITKGGAFLDSTLDRISDGVLFAAIAILLSRGGS